VKVSLEQVLAPLWPWLEAAAPEEGCAVLLEGPGGFRLQLMRNARTGEAARRGFAFLDAEWLACLREAERLGERVAWIIHSHVEGGTELSREDRDAAALVPGACWLVVRIRGGRVDGCALHQAPGESSVFGGLGRERLKID
jgi:proteasome lid subunit RPN8/RPN11